MASKYYISQMSEVCYLKIALRSLLQVTLICLRTNSKLFLKSTFTFVLVWSWRKDVASCPFCTHRYICHHPDNPLADLYSRSKGQGQSNSQQWSPKERFHTKVYGKPVKELNQYKQVPLLNYFQDLTVALNDIYHYLLSGYTSFLTFRPASR